MRWESVVNAPGEHREWSWGVLGMSSGCIVGAPGLHRE